MAHRLADGIEFTRVGRTYYLYQPSMGKGKDTLFTFDGSAYEMFHGMVEGDDKSAISDRVLTRYKHADREAVVYDLSVFIEQLVKAGVLTRN